MPVGAIGKRNCAARLGGRNYASLTPTASRLKASHDAVPTSVSLVLGNHRRRHLHSDGADGPAFRRQPQRVRGGGEGPVSCLPRRHGRRTSIYFYRQSARRRASNTVRCAQRSTGKIISTFPRARTSGAATCVAQIEPALTRRSSTRRRQDGAGRGPAPMRGSTSNVTSGSRLRRHHAPAGDYPEALVAQLEAQVRATRPRSTTRRRRSTTPHHGAARGAHRHPPRDVGHWRAQRPDRHRHAHAGAADHDPVHAAQQQLAKVNAGTREGPPPVEGVGDDNKKVDRGRAPGGRQPGRSDDGRSSSRPSFPTPIFSSGPASSTT